MTVSAPPPSAVLVHVAAGANAVTGALDWGGDGLLAELEGGGRVSSTTASADPPPHHGDAPLAYGAASSILLYDQAAGRVVAALHGHTGRVNCVRWRRSGGGGGGGGRAELASGGADGRVRVWAVSRPAGTPGRPRRLDATCTAVLETGSPAQPVVALAWFTHPASGEDTLVAAGGDGRVWVRPPPGHADWSALQTLPFGPRLRHAAALAPCPGGGTLLALGGVDGCVELLTRPPGPAALFARSAVAAGGHGDWVRSLAFRPEPGSADGSLLLVSASNDRTAAVWAVRAGGGDGGGGAAEGGGDAAITRLARGGRPAASPTLRVDLSAVLVGHDDWVSAVDWAPDAGWAGVWGGDPATQPPTPTPAAPALLTASADRSVRFWRRVGGGCDADGLWMCEARAGDAGASAVGWAGGCFAPGGGAAAAHGPAGAVHVWRAPTDGGLLWRAERSAGGHTRPITDLCWAGDGGCVLTVSADQTARLSTTAAAAGGPGAPADASVWCEVARPQVHGHDFSAVAALPPPALVYAAASEEKVVRVLSAPGAFVETLALARGAAPRTASAPAAPDGDEPYGAAAPALGLSNRPLARGVSTGGAVPGADADPFYHDGPDAAPSSAPAAVAGPPLEAHLNAGTLWPETVKLYGHAAEVCALAAHPGGRWLASAARGAGPRWCAVWVWDAAAPWSPAPGPGGPAFEAHSATIARLAWSPCGTRLLSAGRDRAWAVHAVADWAMAEGGTPPTDEPLLRLTALRPAAHSRQLYDAAWAPPPAGGGAAPPCCTRFATAARDGTVKVWEVGGGGDASAAADPALELPRFSGPVTALAYAPVRRVVDGADWLAVGTEGGGLELWAVPAAGAGGGGGGAERLWAAPPCDAPGGAVRRLAWKTAGMAGEGGSEPLLLAVGGDDHALRVFSFQL